MNRRSLILAIAAVIGGAMTAAAPAQAGIHRRMHRRMRRRIRRRIRRRVVVSMVIGRPLWVVPVGMVVGWELMHENRVVVVKETHIVTRDGNQVEVATVQDSDGKSEQIELTREDTVENRVNLKGSELPDTDTTTPGVDDEIEEGANG